MRESSFGIFLIHYVPLLWLQYALYGITLAPIMQETAILKALIVFVLTLADQLGCDAALYAGFPSSRTCFKAFSSEVGTGSREQSASEQKPKPARDSKTE